MARKTATVDDKKPVLEQIKEAVANKTAVIGSDLVVKLMKSGALRLVVLASNCPAPVRGSAEQAAKIGGLRVENYEGTGRQLGTFCGKPFSIAALAIKK